MIHALHSCSTHYVCLCFLQPSLLPACLLMFRCVSYVSLCLCVRVSVCPCFCVFVFMCFSVSLCLCVCVYVCLCGCVSVCLCVCVSFCLPFHVSVGDLRRWRVAPLCPAATNASTKCGSRRRLLLFDPVPPTTNHYYNY